MRNILAQPWSVWLLCSMSLLSFGVLASDPAWAAFAARYVAEDGRVVDTGKGGISHSEGQGAALLMAVAAGDKARFDRIWIWTSRHLQVRDDRLLAWRWDPLAGVTDRNNASDGDLLAAWALARAATKWKDAGYETAARDLARAIREKLVMNTDFGPVLLPGIEGFRHSDGPVLNLSYWVFPAFADLQRVDPEPVWAALNTSGLVLLGAARFGRWQLPADWIQVKGDRVVPAPKFPARFGYDAIRIPLYLRWVGINDDRLKPYREYSAYFEGARWVPGWTQFADDSVDSHDGGPGVRSVLQWLRSKNPRSVSALQLEHSYYASFLQMLTRLAAAEVPRK